MKLLLSPKQKLIAASVTLAALLAAAPGAGLNAATAARLLLVAVAAAGLGVWYWRRSPTVPRGPAAAPRLRVIARAGLSARCSVALLEADGRTFLLAYGDGFAELRPAKARATPARRNTAPSFQAELERIAR